MSKKAVVPDAWDDDWEAQADKADAEGENSKTEEQVKVTKAERLANHAETNKKIWDSAETPETFHFLAARNSVPLKTEFKPALKVLSRKPAVRKIDPVTGLAKLILDDDEDEEKQRKATPTPEELRLQAQRQREEKQKKYEEARARIMGTGSGSSSPRTVTPPVGQEDGKGNRGKGRGRDNRGDNRRPTSSQSGHKELFDPGYTPKPGVSIQKRSGEISRSGTSTPRAEEQIIRSPRGPDGSGRGGFGFGNRGAKKG